MDILGAMDVWEQRVVSSKPSMVVVSKTSSRVHVTSLFGGQESWSFKDDDDDEWRENGKEGLLSAHDLDVSCRPNGHIWKFKSLSWIRVVFVSCPCGRLIVLTS